MEITHLCITNCPTPSFIFQSQSKVVKNRCFVTCLTKVVHISPRKLSCFHKSTKLISFCTWGITSNRIIHYWWNLQKPVSQQNIIEKRVITHLWYKPTLYYPFNFNWVLVWTPFQVCWLLDNWHSIYTITYWPSYLTLIGLKITDDLSCPHPGQLFTLWMIHYPLCLLKILLILHLFHNLNHDNHYPVSFNSMLNLKMAI